MIKYSHKFDVKSHIKMSIEKDVDYLSLYAELGFTKETEFGRVFIESQTFKSGHNLHKHKKCNLNILLNMISPGLDEGRIPLTETVTTKKFGNGPTLTTSSFEELSHDDIKVYVAFNLTYRDYQKCVNDFLSWVDEAKNEDVMTHCSGDSIEILPGKGDIHKVIIPSPYVLIGGIIKFKSFWIMIRSC